MDPKELRKIQIDIRRNIAPDKVHTVKTVQYLQFSSRMWDMITTSVADPEYFFPIRNPK
jgi:hypothetical protein